MASNDKNQSYTKNFPNPNTTINFDDPISPNSPYFLHRFDNNSGTVILVSHRLTGEDYACTDLCS